MADLLFGIHPLNEALAAGRRTFKALYVSKRRRTKGVEALLERAGSKGIPIQYKDPAFFHSHLGQSTHQGVAAEAGSLPLTDEETILKRAHEDSSPPLVLVLDGIVDPQNLGALVRSALALGVHGIILPKVRAAPLSPAVSKASAGAMEHMSFARVTNLVSALERLKKAGLWVVGTDVGSGTPVDKADFDTGIALVIGGEGKGMRPLVRKTCDFLVSVPLAAGMDSLNAAVAGAIVMYEILRQRRSKGQRAKS